MLKGKEHVFIMKNTLKFLIEANKLKEMPRTGWVLMSIKNPESVAEHVFRTTMATWLLAKKRGLNVQRAMKIALVHDLSEVYAGDVTPSFYYPKLPAHKRGKDKVLMKWVRLSQKEKQRRAKIKFKKEKKSLLKLINGLPSLIRKEILSLWLDYGKKMTREAKFVKQVDRIELLIQSIEYFGVDSLRSGTSWWEGTKEIVEDPLLLDFLEVIKRKFYGAKIKSFKGQKELEDILNFILDIGRLKRTPRLYWKIRGIKKDIETVAEHIFTLSLMSWVLSRSTGKQNVGKLIKIALAHELSAIDTGDTTPYDRLLPKDEDKKKKILKKWPRLSSREKKKRYLKDLDIEKKAIKKVTKKLNPKFRKEIISLWKEYRTRSTPEGRFVSQLNSLAVLVEALDYEKSHKKFSAAPIWEWALEMSDSIYSLELMDAMKKKFYK
jgi:putative hydrolase of HD superfamily